MITSKVSRRAFMAGATGAILIPNLTASAATWVVPTRYIDSTQPLIISTADSLTRHLQSSRARALAIFAFVRDTIKFGFAPQFYDMTASQVLRAGIGFCNTKSTLFVALLRAAGIPARQVFVDIDARILAGILDPGTLRVDHSYVEVLLDGMWIATDAYIVDPALHLFATRILASRQEGMGLGVHVDGTTAWDGVTPSFSQYVVAEHARSINHGIFADVGDFYDRSSQAWNRRGIMTRLFFGEAARSANEVLERLRTGGAP